MSDEYRNPNSIKSLEVLPNSGKVEQLKQEFAADPLKKHNETSLVDRAVDPSKTPAQKAIEEKVITALRTVYDPEIPVNIYDLGLIYDIDVDAETSAVSVRMTLTAPGCPVAGTLPGEVQKKIETVAGVPQAVVELVWDTPWSKDRMSEAALLELGLL
ncbi:MAG TPA: iron-sulfur cluster assembly protein [Tepidisphaeraceae bacterium]|nr:iron-sulfur cluster assembly protein [Tepidisphaeraceae bacterium]